MAVEVVGPRPPSNKIGTETELRLKSEKKVWVEHPETGERAFVTIANARDMVERRRGKDRWTFAQPLPSVNPVASIAEQKAADALEQARELLRAAGELPSTEEQGLVVAPVVPPAIPGADPQPDALAASAVEDPDFADVVDDAPVKPSKKK